MKKKLLIVHNFYREFGGEDANIREEINFFSEKYDIRFFSADNNTKLNLIDIVSFSFRTNILLNKNFKKELLEFNPDAVYVHNTWFKINLGIFKILKKYNINSIIKIHNFRFDCARYYLSKNHLKGESTCSACSFKKKKYPIFNRYYEESLLKSLLLIFYSKKYFKIIKNNFFKIVSISEFQKSVLLNSGIRESSLTVINNPISFESDSEIDIKNNYLIYAGRVSKEKGVNQLIDAWNNSKLSEYDLYIIGEGSQKKILQDKYKNKNIKFLGQLENKEVLKLIKNAKAVVTATTLFEGQPRLLCEASSLKTVSIYPSFGGMDEFFPKNYPYSFKQYNYDDLILKLNLVLDNELLLDSSESVKNFISTKLDSDNIAEQFNNLIVGE